jgi:hypothetical protein
MKRIVLLISIVFIYFGSYAQTLKPYIIGITSNKTINDLSASVIKALETNHFTVVGFYTPANDETRKIIVLSHKELINAVVLKGGLRGFAATLRLAITVEDGKTIVSYTNPEYWGRAYFQNSYEDVVANYKIVSTNFIESMKAVGSYDGTPFGSEKGLSAKDLLKYHYMMGMPYFDDAVELESFDSQTKAIKKIEANLMKGVPYVKQVYKVEIPNKDIVLYGFALSGEDGESNFLPIIDISNPKHTAFLPYEVLVMDGEVYMLHGRFRIAIAFPDLSMGTFTKIMSTPGNIEDMLEKLVE